MADTGPKLMSAPDAKADISWNTLRDHLAAWNAVGLSYCEFAKIRAPNNRRTGRNQCA